MLQHTVTDVQAHTKKYLLSNYLNTVEICMYISVFVQNAYAKHGVLVDHKYERMRATCLS